MGGGLVVGTVQATGGLVVGQAGGGGQVRGGRVVTVGQEAGGGIVGQAGGGGQLTGAGRGQVTGEAVVMLEQF